jgi:hypothetical protein
MNEVAAIVTGAPDVTRRAAQDAASSHPYGGQ